MQILSSQRSRDILYQGIHHYLMWSRRSARLAHMTKPVASLTASSRPSTTQAVALFSFELLYAVNSNSPGCDQYGSLSAPACLETTSTPRLEATGFYEAKHRLNPGQRENRGGDHPRLSRGTILSCQSWRDLPGPLSSRRKIGLWNHLDGVAGTRYEVKSCRPF